MNGGTFSKLWNRRIRSRAGCALPSDPVIRRTLPLAVALATLGCSEPETAAPTPAEPPPADPAEPAPTASDPAEPAPDPEPPPLAEPRTLRIRAADGVELVGDLRAGQSLEAPLVILVHQLSTTRAEWEPLLRRLGASPALTTFALDMRGHGESTHRDGARGGGEVSWEGFETADWEKVSGDVLTVLGHLRAEEHLSPGRVILVGSSIGSSAVIRAAAADEGIDAVVAISPGRAYRGLDALTPLPRLGSRALLTVAAAEETGAATTAEDMARIATTGEAVIAQGNRHGVGLFEDDPSALGRVVEFIRSR